MCAASIKLQTKKLESVILAKPETVRKDDMSMVDAELALIRRKVINFIRL